MRAGTRVVLALGGGSARGVAHIGVLRALDEAGIQIAAIAGTSIGSVVGGMYAAGKLDAYAEFMYALGRRDVFGMLDPVLPRSGLFAGKRLSELLKSFVGEARIEDLRLPYCAVAVDVSGGDEIRIRSGSLVDAMRASFAIPGLFTPFALTLAGEASPRWLVDGCVASPVPVMAARDLGSLPIIAVNVNRGFDVVSINKKVVPDARRSRRERIGAFLNTEHVPQAARDFLGNLFETSASSSGESTDGKHAQARNIDDSRSGLLGRWNDLFSNQRANTKRPGMVDSLYSSVLLLQHHLARSQFVAEPPALLIEPNMEGIGLFDYHLGGLLIDEGYRATRAALGAFETR